MKISKFDIKYILILALPIIIENILQTLLGTTDTYFAGQLADTAIAGISVTNMIMNIFISFFTAVSIGTAAVVSRNYGRRHYDDMNKSIMQSIIIALILGVIVGIITLVFYRPILSLSGADNRVIDAAIPYYMAVSLPSVILCLQLVLSSCLRAMKDTLTPMYITGVSNILNIILNILFIRLGLGILGLGLATTLSRIISVMLMMYKLCNHEEHVSFKKESFKMNKSIINSILSIGIPAGIEKLIMRIGQLIYNGMIISIGMNAYVAHNIAGTIESYSYIPAMGFGLAISTLVGISLGEKSISKARKLTFTSYMLSMICMVIIGFTFYIFAPQLASLFTKTSSVQKMIVQVLRIIAFFQPFSALVQILTNALQGAGDTKFPMYTTILGIWGIRIGIGYTFSIPFGLGLSGVWYAYALDLVVRGIFLLLRFYKGKWETIRI